MSRWRSAFLTVLTVLWALTPVGVLLAQAPLRHIGTMQLAVVGLSAGVEPALPVVPKNTPAGVRVVVRSGTGEVSSADLARFFGTGVHVEADFSGPGLYTTLPLSSDGEGDRLLLSLPPLQTSGDYRLANIRLVANDRPVLDVTPSQVPVQVIEQVLITSVTTRPLTLDEIRNKGIVLDRDDYLGFEFTMGVLLESRPVQVTFPVVFGPGGTPLPEFTFIRPQLPAPGLDLPSLPYIMPTMLVIEAPGGETLIPRFDDGRPMDVRIPGVLVIPGSVGYLKQFFSAQLFVANGAPGGSRLTVRDITGTIRLPAGDDRAGGTPDDPLSLATVQGGVQGGPAPSVMGVVAAGPDGAQGTTDDEPRLMPGEQGQAEFLLRSDQEGFHTIDFDIAGVLDGLATGPATVKGKASGAVLVRNPYFDVTFTVPSVVRRGERFTLFATVTNKSEGSPANELTMAFDASRMSGMRLHADETGTRQIDTLRPRDSRTLQFEFVSERTGQVVASYLRFHTETGSNGTIRFTAGVGERGIALSPDTLVLPASVDALPDDVVEAAMRVVGQAWSISLATDGTRPAGVLPIARAEALAKGVALAEAGLRVTLGQPAADSLRDFVLDFYGPAETGLNAGTLDPGFDQLLRTTEAGHSLRRALGAALGQAVQEAGGPLAYQQAWASLLASGSDRLTFAVTGAAADISIVDAAGRRTDAANVPNGIARSDVASTVILPASDVPDAPLLGVVTQPLAGPYVIELSGRETGTIDLAVAVTRGDGVTVRGVASGVAIEPNRVQRLRIDPSDIQPFFLEDDAGEGPGTAIGADVLAPVGARLLSANIVGPEIFSTASPLGQHVALLFDRAVDPEQVTDATLYAMSENRVVRAGRVLSGRFVIAEIEQPEGPYVPASMAVAGVADLRDVRGPAVEQPLRALVRDMGAVVSGRVFSADGVGVGGLEVFYSNVYATDCTYAFAQIERPRSVVRTEADGSYQFRYVRKDTECNAQFRLTAQDPPSGSVRRLSRQVNAEGERIVLDLGLFGRGTVTGVVRDLAGQPVGGAHIVVFSETDRQIQESALTDGTGRYTIARVLVGPVNVVARKAFDNGATVRQGTSGGNLARAGNTVNVDVVIDTGSASVSGTVRLLTAGESQPAAGALVLYRIRKVGDLYETAAGLLTGADGSFSFPSVPVGAFILDVAFNAGLTIQGTLGGLVGLGQTLTGLDVVLQSPATATVRGRVRRSDNTSVPGAMVRYREGATFTDESGVFEVTPVEVRPSEPQTLVADTPDRRRGIASILVTQPGVLDNVVITLSALGSVEFTLLDGTGAPVPNQNVDLLADQFGLRGACAIGCGCALVSGTTNASGVVRFHGLPAGLVRARAIRFVSGFADVADGRATILTEGHVARGVMRFEGFGSIAGVVFDPEGRPAVGADVSVRSRRMNNEMCSLENGRPSHAIRTDHLGRFTLSSVGVGPVSILASHAFLPTPVGAELAITAPGEARDLTLRLLDTFAGELSGRVLLPDGVTPAGPGVDVTINGPLPDITVRTGDEGGFRFARILPAGTYRVTAADPATGAVVQESVNLGVGQDVAHELRLKGRGTVRVRVVDALDAPVVNAIVRLQETSYPNRLLEGVADEASGGVMTFEQVFEGPLSVDVSDAFGRGGRAWGTVPAPGSTIDVKVRITVTGTVRGRFLMPDGTPIPYGIVRLLAGGREIGQATTSGVDDVGSFAFHYVPAGSIRLDAHDPASARTGIAAGTLNGEGELLMLDVRTEGLGTVTGVVTAGGAPQPAAEVDLTSGQFRVRAVTDGDGRYSITGVPEGHVSVHASIAGDIQTGAASGTLAGDGATVEINVAVRDAGRVTGTVVPALPGPLSQTIVMAGSGNLVFTAATDAEGHFVFDRLPAGRVRLTADVLGTIDTGRLDVDVAGSQTTDVEIRLQGVGAIRGRALDSAGLPATGVLSLRGTGISSYSIHLSIGADGLFQFPELLAGPVTVTFESVLGTSRLYGNASATVTPGEEVVVDVRLQDSATMVGRVLRADGDTPAIGAEASITLISTAQTIPVQVQTDGQFTGLGVPLGAFTLRIADPFTRGVALVTGRATTTNGETLDLGTIVLDDARVEVTSVNPSDGATAVAIDRDVVVTFSDPLQSPSGVVAKKGTSTISTTQTLSADGRSVTVRPAGEATWPDESDVIVVATTSVTDVHGRHPAQEFTSRFRTVDLSPPHVVTTVPGLAAVNVTNDAAIDIQFHESLAASTDFDILIAVTGPAGPVPGTTTQTRANAARFTPGAPLVENATYQVVVNGAVDLPGNAQVAPHTFSFTTRDTIPPVLTVTQPGAWTRATVPPFRVEVQDAVSGIDNASGRVWIDGVPAQALQSPGVLSGGAPTPLTEGAYVLRASVSDRAGNISAVERTFGVDVTPPDVPVIVGVSDGQLVIGLITIGATAADALSGVARIDLLRDGTFFTSLPAPSFEAAISTSALIEGPRTLTAVAYDAAGNASASSSPLHVIVDNQPLSVFFWTPAANARTNATITVHAAVNEPVARIELSLGATTIVDATDPYQAAFDTAVLAEGMHPITATAVDQSGGMAVATRTIVVDRTGPAAPDVTRINAEPPSSGISLVVAASGAIESNARVTIINTITSATATTIADSDGSFSASIAASVDDILSVRGADDLGNVGPASTVVVRSTPSTPADETAATLRFEGVLADRVSAATGGSALATDGVNDALFTFALVPSDALTRQLFSIRLDNEDDGGTRNTDPGPGGIVGVAYQAGDAFLNAGDGRIGFAVTGETTFSLFVHNGGLIREGATYRATAAFTDGSRFVGRFRIVPAAERAQVAHLATITPDAPTVVVSPGIPGTAQLTVTNIRDLDGTLVPNGARIALSATHLASKDPRGNGIPSVGGLITDGEIAANHVDFRVFTISGGRVVATYSTGSLVPAPITGAHAVVQMLPADEHNNVIGQTVVATADLNLRAASDQAILHVSPGSLYADGADHRATITAQVRTPAGARVAEGTVVYLIAAANGAAGSIVGGLGYVPFTVANGQIVAQYSSSGAAVSLRETSEVRTVTITAYPAFANGSMDGSRTLGTAQLILVPAAGAEMHMSPGSLPWVFPDRNATVLVHHVHDLRGHLVPDASPFLLSAQANWKYRGTTVSSWGGSIADGMQSQWYGAAYRLFALEQNRIAATYTTGASTGSPSVPPGENRTARVSVMPVPPSGIIQDGGLAEAIAAGKIVVVAPGAAVGTAQPASVLGDGALRTSTVTFGPVLDAFGNPLPDGSIVLARARGQGESFQVRDGAGNTVSLTSAWGGQILNGPPGTGNIGGYTLLPVQSGSVTAVYGTPAGGAVGTGDMRTAYVTLSEYAGPGNFAGTPALGYVPVQIVGATSASGSASPSVLYTDFGDRRSMVTFSNFRDASGNPVPDGSKVIAELAVFGTGSIVNGTVPPCCGTPGRLFTIVNGQVVVEYSAQGISGSSTAMVRLLPGSASGSMISMTPLASVSIQLTSAAASGTVTITPADLFADSGDRRANVVVTGLRDSGGNPLPEGSKVVLRPRTSSGFGTTGTLIGLVAGDGVPVSGEPGYWTFTAANGEVRAMFSASGIALSPAGTETRVIDAFAGRADGSRLNSTVLTSGTLQVHGATFATFNGPPSVPGTSTTAVTFSGIKDNAGNQLPDGAKVALEVTVCYQFGGCSPSQGPGITSQGGEATSESGIRAFTVVDGAIEVPFTVGSAVNAFYSAVIRVFPARPDGARVTTTPLTGGNVSIPIVP